MACRKARAAEWSVRLMHELDSWSSGVFVTLTYNTEHLPDSGSLSKRDLQLYFKRLRRSLGDRRIKYYACGSMVLVIGVLTTIILVLDWISQRTRKR